MLIRVLCCCDAQRQPVQLQCLLRTVDGYHITCNNIMVMCNTTRHSATLPQSPCCYSAPSCPSPPNPARRSGAGCACHRELLATQPHRTHVSDFLTPCAPPEMSCVECCMSYCQPIVRWSWRGAMHWRHHLQLPIAHPL